MLLGRCALRHLKCGWRVAHCPLPNAKDPVGHRYNVVVQPERLAIRALASCADGDELDFGTALAGALAIRLGVNEGLILQLEHRSLEPVDRVCLAQLHGERLWWFSRAVLCGLGRRARDQRGEFSQRIGR
jgi:hypothetical protein